MAAFNLASKMEAKLSFQSFLSSLAAAPTSDTEKKKQKPGEFKTPPRLRQAE